MFVFAGEMFFFFLMFGNARPKSKARLIINLRPALI